MGKGGVWRGGGYKIEVLVGGGMFLGSRGGIKSNIGFFGACGADRGGGGHPILDRYFWLV